LFQILELPGPKLRKNNANNDCLKGRVAGEFSPPGRLPRRLLGQAMTQLKIEAFIKVDSPRTLAMESPQGSRE
jgi:hypothetical protein